MDASDAGSFVIALRLFSALKSHVFAEKRAKLLSSFFKRYASEKRDVTMLVDLAFSLQQRQRKQSTAAGDASATGEESGSVLQLLLKRGSVGRSLKAATLPTTSITEVHFLVRLCCMILDGKLAPPTSTAVAAQVEQMLEEYEFAAPDEASTTTIQEALNAALRVTKSLTAQERDAVDQLVYARSKERVLIGPLCRPCEFLECLGCSEKRSDDPDAIYNAITIACGGSPRAVAESFLLVPGDESEGETGTASTSSAKKQQKKQQLAATSMPVAPPVHAGELLDSDCEVDAPDACSGKRPVKTRTTMIFREPTTSRVEKRERAGEESKQKKEDDDDLSMEPSVYAKRRRKGMEKEAKADDSVEKKKADKAESATAEEAPATPTAAVPCKYGAKCIRLNPEHFKQFSHPAGVLDTLRAKGVKIDASAASFVAPATARTATAITTRKDAKAEEGNAEDRAIGGVKPLRYMKEQHAVHVGGGSGDAYKIKYCGCNVYTCTCAVWRFQMKGADVRTCKHLKQYLGEEFEAKRCGDTVTSGTGAAAKTAKATGGAAKAGTTASSKKFPFPQVLLAQKATPGGSYTGYWISEKLDGVRAYWDGERLLSRNGNMFTAPDWFISCFPKSVTLDGELFGGRKKFQSTVGVVKSSAAHPGWKTLTYELFDIPSIGDTPFEERLTKMQELFPSSGATSDKAHVHVVEHAVCKGKSHVCEELARVEGLGGEGLMLREPKSKYVHSRSYTLLKVKSTEEIDCIIRGYDKGKGKHEGKVGALAVEMANGNQFSVGSGLTDAQRAKPPSVGSVVCVRFQELTDGGVPRFPVFQGARYDVDWPPPPGATTAKKKGAK